MSAALERALRELSDRLADCQDPWALIGSAAITARGVSCGPVRDIDVMVSHADAETLLRTAAFTDATSPSDTLFRSDIFLRSDLGAFGLDIMAGLHLRQGQKWLPVAMPPTDLVNYGSAQLPVPSLEELGQLCNRFGREKDIRRLALIKTHLEDSRHG